VPDGCSVPPTALSQRGKTSGAGEPLWRDRYQAKGIARSSFRRGSARGIIGKARPRKMRLAIQA